MAGAIKTIRIEKGIVKAASGGLLASTDLTATGVTAGTYSNATVTVDAAGRVTSIQGGTVAGTVTSVGLDGGSTGLTFSGGPITSAGTVTLAGTLGVGSGGTGATTAAGARTALGLVPGTDVQAYSAELAALAALSGTGLVTRTGTATYAIDTSTYLTTASATSTYLPLAGGTLTGDLSLSGTGRRITGDFTNATHASRTLFQTTTANSNTVVGALPSGSGTTGQFNGYNSSDTANSCVMQVGVNTTATYLNTQALGTGTLLPIEFRVSGTAKASVATDGTFSALAGFRASGTVELDYNTTSADSNGVIWYAGNGTTARQASFVSDLQYNGGSPYWRMYTGSTVLMTIDGSGNMAVAGLATVGTSLTTDVTATANAGLGVVYYTGNGTTAQQSFFRVRTVWNGGTPYLQFLWADSTSAATLTKVGNFTTAGSITAVGAVTGSNLSGTNTGDQTITLTGDVTGSGTGSFATAIGAGKVTNTMLAGSIDLTTKVTGTLPVGNGGTGQTTYTNGQLLIGNTTGNTLTKGTLTAPAAGITITGGTGTITFALANDLSGVEGLSGTGLATRTASDTWTTRTITGTTDKITVTNGDGVSGNPTLTIASTYVGQTSITTLGTITTGTWTGTAIAVANGGTGATSAATARTNLGVGTGDSPTFAGLSVNGAVVVSVAGNPLTTTNSTAVTSTLNNVQLLSSFKGLTGGNTVFVNTWLRRNTAAGADWQTTSVHTGIGVDASFLVPNSTTRCWWERDINNGRHTWGDSAATFLRLDSTGLYHTHTGSNSAVSITSTSARGAEVQLVDNQTGTPKYKYIRNLAGTLGVINEAYNAILFSVTDAGAATVLSSLDAGGSITSSVNVVAGANNTATTPSGSLIAYVGNGTVANHSFGYFQTSYNSGNTRVLIGLYDGTNFTSGLTVDKAGLVTATTFSGSGASLTALNASNLASGTVALARLPAAPSCIASHNADQSIGTGAWTSLALNTESVDTDSFHSTVTNNSRITIPAGLGGKYLLFGSIQWAASASGVRGIRFLKNGANTIGLDLRTNNGGSQTSNMTITFLADLAAGDYVEFQGFQDSGGGLNANFVSGYSPVFGAVRIGT